MAEWSSGERSAFIAGMFAVAVALIGGVSTNLSRVWPEAKESVVSSEPKAEPNKTADTPARSSTVPKASANSSPVVEPQPRQADERSRPVTTKKAPAESSPEVMDKESQQRVIDEAAKRVLLTAMRLETAVLSGVGIFTGPCRLKSADGEMVNFPAEVFWTTAKSEEKNEQSDLHYRLQSQLIRAGCNTAPRDESVEPSQLSTVPGTVAIVTDDEIVKVSNRSNSGERVLARFRLAK